MNVELFRRIGKKLLEAIPALKDEAANVIGTGASGDRTYRIDKTAEDIILSSLESSSEGLTLISEEMGTRDLNGGGKKVLVDPIDGSRNAVSGIPFYCTSVAVVDGNTIGAIELAYVVNLVTGDEFWAEKGKGAFKNGRRMATQKGEELLLVAYESQSPRTDIAEMFPLIRESNKTRCLGATALDLAYLAAGSVSVFVNPSPSRSFDFAGGWLLVLEAGGVFSDTIGNSIEKVEVGLKRSTPLLASANPALHEKALKLLRQ